MRFGGTLIADSACVPEAWTYAFAARLAASVIGLTDRPERPLPELVAAVSHT